MTPDHISRNYIAGAQRPGVYLPPIGDQDEDRAPFEPGWWLVVAGLLAVAFALLVLRL